MAYPQRQFQQAPSNPSYSGRHDPYLPQQQHSSKEHAYHRGPHNDGFYDRPSQEVLPRQDRDSRKPPNVRPDYGSPQSYEQNAVWSPEMQQQYIDSREAGRFNQYQMRPRQRPYQDPVNEYHGAGLPPAGPPYQQNQMPLWRGKSPQMSGHQQNLHQPKVRDPSGRNPISGYDGTGSQPRINEYQPQGADNSHYNDDREFHNSLEEPDPQGVFDQQQQPWPIRDRRDWNAEYASDRGQEPLDAPGRSYPPNQTHGRPKKSAKERIRMNPMSPETISWDNPFPTFPKHKKNNNHTADKDLNHSMADMSIESRSNVRQGGSNRLSTEKGKVTYESSRNDGQACPRPIPQEKPVKMSHIPMQNKPPGGRTLPSPHDEFDSIQHQFPQTKSFQDGPRPQTDHDRYSEDIPGGYAFRQPGAYQGDSQRSKTMPNNISTAMIDSYPPSSHGRKPPLQGSRDAFMNEHEGRDFDGLPPSHSSKPPMHHRSQSIEYGFANQARDGDQWALNPRPQHSQQSSLGDYFDSYYHSPHHSDPSFAQRHANQLKMPLDEDMPNFDRITETGASHRRGLTINDHLHLQQNVPPMPSQSQLAASGRSPPVSRSAEGFSKSKSSPNLQEQRTQRTQQYSDGFDFELPGSVPAMYSPGPSPIDDDRERNIHSDASYQPSWRQNTRENPSPASARSHHAFSRPGTSESNGRQPFPRPPGGQSRPSTSRDSSSHDRQGQGLRNGPSPVRRVGPTSPPVGPQGNPDALPPHPAPVRAGLIQSPPANQPSRPAPVRQYSEGLSSHAQTSSSPKPQISRPPREKDEAAAVSSEGLERLRQNVRKNPSDNHTQLLLAKKLVEAASVLANEGGRVDARTTSKNRERFISEAYKLVKKMVQSGYPEAVFYLGDCYTRGALGLETDPKEAFNHYQSAAKAGHAQAAYRVAVCCEMGLDEGGGTKRDAVKAVQWYHRAATLGNPPAMYKMGVIQLKGLLGQPKNFKEALSWLQRAAERADKENPHALHELALLYESSSGIEGLTKDETHAKQLFIEAANLGYKFSQFRLGCAFEYGLLGCPIDPRQSIAWYSKAAVQDEHQSELALSGWYLTGSEGILQQSDTEAYLWARKAAQAGLAKAEYAMGYFTEVGIGAAANIEDAKRWYWRSASQNFPKARERLEDLRRGGAKMQKTRVSRSKINKQSEGECVIM
ncbi:MAG: hypothetical protein Q9166_002774 [cf. Caloplaca sp. 2 TL-2023]